MVFVFINVIHIDTSIAQWMISEKNLTVIAIWSH